MQKKNRTTTTNQPYLDIVSTFAVDLLSMNSIDEIIWHAARNVVAKLGFEDVVIYLFDEQKNKLVQSATFGHKNPKEYEIFEPIEIALGAGVVGKVAVSFQPIIIKDTRLDVSYIVDDQVRLSELAVPMLVDNKLIGVIDSEHVEVNFYTKEHLKSVLAIASLIATQISRFEMISQLEQVIIKLEYSGKIQDSLFEIAELIFTTENIDDFYHQLHSSIGRLTFANNFYIALRSDDKKSFCLPYCVDENDEVEKNEIISLESSIPSISGYVLKNNIPLLIYKSEIETKINNKELYLVGSLPQAWLGVPFGDEQNRGIVVVQSYTNGYIFTQKDKQLLIFVAKHIHNAIERMQTKSELQFLALHDPLTKLPNRLLFTDRVEQAIVKAKRNEGLSIAVLFLDLDRFKQVNDNYGHHVGDQLLIEVSARINLCIRESDTLCRIGGDEFAVLLENLVNSADVEKISLNIIDTVQQKMVIDSAKINISTSIGITVFDQGEISTTELLVQADEAMYRAKLNGRNQAVLYKESEDSNHPSSYKLDCDFLAAMEKLELYLVYQPIVDLKTDVITSAESLIRWQHPEHGLVMPDVFLPELERAGYLSKLDLYVLDQAISFLGLHRDRFPSDFCLSINISGKGFSEPELIARIKYHYKQTPKLLSYLCLEITEQTIVGNIQNTQNTIQIYHSMGVKIALDDFGTGYSSLSYINYFTLNMLKIDRSFINNLEQGKNNTIILEAIIKVAKSLSIQTVAEGIETESQYSFLKELGCDKGQGFYMSTPIVEKEFIQKLVNNQ
ncbi:MAG: bifunctional diguanylate cyclase/phosphodiesterase [Colwellia sp.]|nr:bifunctional diguanylate cyclase/phosphodiesterase [Colwellia sp.]